MITIKLTKDIPDQGLVAGDIMQVDKFSAASMVKREVAEEYNPEQEAREVDAPSGEYGGRPAATIDDIHDPDAQRDRRVQVSVHVAAADPGPPQQPPAALVPDPAAVPAKASSKKAASGAEPVGGDAGGGDGNS